MPYSGSISEASEEVPSFPFRRSSKEVSNALLLDGLENSSHWQVLSTVSPC